jgi:hypothetical protein
MTTNALATTNDLEDMWRPLTSSEIPRAVRLINKASSLLRQKAPYVDARMARFTADSTDLGGLDPTTVSMVVATMVKRFLSNVDGIVTEAEAAGPFNHSRTYAIRGEKDVRGELQVTASDLEALAPHTSKRSALGSIRTRPHLARWPYGDVGGPPASTGTADLWLAEIGRDLGTGEFPVYGSNHPADS